MYYIHSDGDDVWLSCAGEPLRTVVRVFDDYQKALSQLMIFSDYYEPEEQYIYEEDDLVWFA